MEALFWQAAGPLAGDDGPSAVMLAEMPLAGADGMLVSVADTAVNRNLFGTTGTGDGSCPFPQLRVVALIARAGRAMLGTILGQASAGNRTPGPVLRPGCPRLVIQEAWAWLTEPS